MSNQNLPGRRNAHHGPQGAVDGVAMLSALAIGRIVQKKQVASHMPVLGWAGYENEVLKTGGGGGAAASLGRAIAAL